MLRTFDEYQSASASTAVYPDSGTGSTAALAYVSLGLGEVGEVQGKVADLSGVGGSEDEWADVAAELGDVLWYIARFAHELGLPLSQIAQRPFPEDPDVDTFDGFEGSVVARCLGSTLEQDALALGCAGDLQGMVKKILRGDPAAAEPAYRDKLAGQLALLLRNVALLTARLGVPLASVAQSNLDKLTDRAARGTLKGAGDHR